MRYMSMVFVSFLMSGCVSLAPEYERPSAPVPSTWKMDVNESNQSVLELSWKAFIRDERLSRVVAQSLEQSRDLRKAVANIEAARAMYKIQRSMNFQPLRQMLRAQKRAPLRVRIAQRSLKVLPQR